MNIGIMSLRKIDFDISYFESAQNTWISVDGFLMEPLSNLSITSKKSLNGISFSFCQLIWIFLCKSYNFLTYDTELVCDK